MMLDKLDAWVLSGLAQEIGAKTCCIVAPLPEGRQISDAIPCNSMHYTYRAIPKTGPVDLVVYAGASDFDKDEFIAHVEGMWKILSPGGAMAFLGATHDATVAGSMKPLFGRNGTLGDQDVILATRNTDALRRDGGREYERSSVYVVCKDSAVPELAVAT